MTDWITIRGEALSAAINPLGAELSSLMDAAGREFMTDADPRWWTGRAPVLFPIVGELAGGAYRLGGATYKLARHGFARRSRFDVADRSDQAVSFRLSDSAATRAVYPFAFALELRFAIAGATLQIAATVTNPGAKELPFSFGFHPALAWPLPGGAAKADHRVTFARPEPAPIRRLDSKGLVKPEGYPTPVDGNVLAPDASLFEGDALMWDQLASRAATFGAPGGGAVELAFPDAPMLGIWQKPGAPYLCIEPWHGLADAEGFAGELTDKPGVVRLAPGGTWQFRLDLTPRDA